MKINKKIDSKISKMRYSVENNILNPGSPLNCDKCHVKLGIIHMLRRSIFVKKGVEYFVICKYCGTKNKRVKGQIGQKIDQDWEKYGY